jgi:sulfite exporter TauE/SafE
VGDALVKGLLLGLSTGGFCLGACAPAMLPYLVSRQWEGVRSTARRGAEFLAGRLLAYLVFALLVVGLGARVRTSPVVTRAAAAAMALLAVALVLHGLSLSFPEWKTCRALERSGMLRRFPFLAGMALGISICPPLLLAFTYLLTLGHWGSGLGFAVAFFIGTTVYLVPLFLSGMLGRLPSLRGAAEVAAVCSGVWFFMQAAALWRHV